MARVAGFVQRPRVLVNCACTLDGKIAAPDGAALPLSDETDWRRVHRLRADSDAILVGIGTVLKDDPRLRVNPDYAPTPPNRPLLRVVLDAKGRTPRNAKVVDGSQPTVIFVAQGVAAKWAGATTVEVPLAADGQSLDLDHVLSALHGRGVETLMVEGGARVIRAFLNSPYVDQWTLYQAPVLVGGTGPSIFDGRPSMIGRRLHVENVVPQGKGVLWTLRP